MGYRVHHGGEHEFAECSKPAGRENFLADAEH
jgi:hypothetical protein